MMYYIKKKPEPRHIREWRLHVKFYRELMESAEDAREELSTRLAGIEELVDELNSAVEEIEDHVDELNSTLDEIELDLEEMAESSMTEKPVDTRLWMTREEATEENHVGKKDADTRGEEWPPF